MKALTRLFYKVKYSKPLIVVSGLPRSGTSMIVQMLEAGGLKTVTDGVREADEDNPRGYYELERVKELGEVGDKSWLRDHRGKAIKIISFLLRNLPLNLNYSVLFIQRDLDEILASQEKMLQRLSQEASEVENEKMKQNYTHHLKQVDYLLHHTPNFEVLYVNHQDVLNQPEAEALRICNFLGRHLDSEEMASVVDKTLYRNRNLGLNDDRI